MRFDLMIFDQLAMTLKPMPEPEVIPPNGSAKYPEAAADR